MKRSLPLPLMLPVLGLGTSPGWAQRPSRNPLNSINVTYHGGPLLQNVKVTTLFYGSDWSSSNLPDYFNGFFKAVFADGRYMANLAQYSAGGYTIGNGTFATTDMDAATLPATVKDAQIQAEIRAQVAAGNLPAPDDNTLYFVFTAPHIVVEDAYGNNSAQDFSGYHDYAPGSDGFSYAIIPYDNSLSDARKMTAYASHELAEAVTDPQPTDTGLGWYDNRNGEIGDIPVSLYLAGRISLSGLTELLTASDGTAYLVQKEWSNQDSAPVAFAP
jgi:hypothetical protein